MTTEELAVQIAEVDQRSKSNTHRLDTLEKTANSIHELAQSVAVMAKGQEHLTKDVTEIKEDVQALKAIPSKRWEQVVDKVFFGLVGLILGAIVSAIVAALK